VIAKSKVIKDRGGKSGGRAVKAVGLTSGGLCCVSATRLRSPQGDLTAAQKSAEGVIGGGAPLKARTVEVASRTALLVRAMRQKNQVELNLGTGGKGEAPNAAAQESEARAAGACLERPAVAGPSMEAVIERENLKKALAQVKRNKGAAGTDGLSVDDLPAYLKEHWPTIRVQLLAGTYKPQPVPLHPAGGDAGIAGGLGPDVLRGELRLPTEALGTSGGGAGAGVHRVRALCSGGS
jgi:hypothetical protein